VEPRRPLNPRSESILLRDHSARTARSRSASRHSYPMTRTRCRSRCGVAPTRVGTAWATPCLRTRIGRNRCRIPLNYTS
jgi:hypothetical protein